MKGEKESKIQMELKTTVKNKEKLNSFIFAIFCCAFYVFVVACGISAQF